MAIKRISIDQLKVGMYFAGCDLPWISTPFWQKRFLVRSTSDIRRLSEYGALEVDVDISRGADPAPPTSQPQTHPPEPITPIAAAPVEDPCTGLTKELARARKAREELLTSVQSVFDNVSAGVVRADQIRHVAHRVVSTTLAQPAAFLALNRARKFDPGLQEHALSVCTLSLFLGQALKYGSGRLEDLAHGALLHDVGLLRLPHYMIRLSRRLSKHEQPLYDKHPRLGAELLQRDNGFHRDVIRIVADHHLTLNTDSKPSDAAQIVGIVDRYVELTTAQVDSPALAGDRALSQIFKEAQSGQYDVAMTSHFVQVLGVYPLFSLVVLNSGEQGIVTRVSPGSLHRPLVRLIVDARGERYPEPTYADLAQETGPQARSIVDVLDEEQTGIRVEDFMTEAIPAELPA